MASASRHAEMEAERRLRRRYPVADELLEEEEAPDPPLGARPLPLAFPLPGLAASRTGDVLQVGDPYLYMCVCVCVYIYIYIHI